MLASKWVLDKLIIGSIIFKQKLPNPARLKMIRQNEWAEINKPFSSGLSIPEVSEITGRTTTTLYRLKSLGGPKVRQDGDFKRLKDLDRFQNYLNKRIKQGVINGKKLHLELENQGYKGSYGTLNRYLNLNLSDLRESHKRFSPFKHLKRKSLREYKRSIRFETEMGEQAQVDWGSFGKIVVNDRVEKLYAFVFILGYSRVPYIEFVIKQNLQTLIQCHINAFKALGITKEIVYDNMKTVVIRRERVPQGMGTIHYNPAFLDFARYYGFMVTACPPYWPRAKGKVEATVKYVRNSFMQGRKFGRDFFTLEELNIQVKKWVKDEANKRIHGTVGERPTDRFEEEKVFLKSIKEVFPYQVSSFTERRCTKDGMVNYKYNLYSVPDEFSRKRVFIKEFNENGLTFIEIYFEDKLIAKHILRIGRGNWALDEKHYIKKIFNKKAKKFKKKTNIVVDVRPLSYYDQLIGI